ncbi:MAG: nodulation efficiency protein D [bacterium]|nr:nodulation efficiency protein D [bacterium]
MLGTIICLLLFGVLLMFAELFVPGGVLGLIGTVLMGVAVYLCFQEYGSQIGVAVLLFSILITVTVVIFAFTVIPKTRFGKLLILGDSVSKQTGYHSDAYYDSGLVGKEGVTESELRPVGIALIDGRRVDVMTDSEFVEPGVRVKVTRIDGNRIVVIRA